MATIAERILDAIAHSALDDDVLAARLGVPQRQSVNQVARRLEAQGLLRRVIGPDGKIVNVSTGSRSRPGPAVSFVRPIDRRMSDKITEDEVKAGVKAQLESLGYDVEVAWGRARGIDVDARHPTLGRLVVEAKGETGHTGPQQVNYFLGALGELLQRMDDPHARYGLALPENRQYRSLADRLPRLAKNRIGLEIFWIVRDASGSLCTRHEE